MHNNIKYIKNIAAISACLFLLCACSQPSNQLSLVSNDSISSSYSTGVMYGPSSNDYGYTIESTSQSSNSYYSDSYNKVDYSSIEDSITTNDNQKLIRTLDISLQIDSSSILQNTVSNINIMVQRAGGYTSYSNVNLDDRWARGNLTVKVPKDKVDSLLDEIKGSEAIIISISDSYEDVTLDYVDIESRLLVKETTRTKYMQFLKEANTVEDMLSVQTRLDSVTEEIESFRAKLNVLNNKIDYTEIDINIECKTSENRRSFLSRAKERLVNIGIQFGNNVLNGLEWFLNALVIVAYVSPILFIVVRVFMYAINWRKGNTHNKENSLFSKIKNKLSNMKKQKEEKKEE